MCLKSQVNSSLAIIQRYYSFMHTALCVYRQAFGEENTNIRSLQIDVAADLLSFYPFLPNLILSLSPSSLHAFMSSQNLE